MTDETSMTGSELISKVEELDERIGAKCYERSEGQRTREAGTKRSDRRRLLGNYGHSDRKRETGWNRAFWHGISGSIRRF